MWKEGGDLICGMHNIGYSIRYIVTAALLATCQLRKQFKEIIWRKLCM